MYTEYSRMVCVWGSFLSRQSQKHADSGESSVFSNLNLFGISVVLVGSSTSSLYGRLSNKCLQIFPSVGPFFSVLRQAE